MADIKLTLHLDSVKPNPPDRELLPILSDRGKDEVLQLATTFASLNRDANLAPELAGTAALLLGAATVISIYRHDPHLLAAILVQTLTQATNEASWGNALLTAGPLPPLPTGVQ